jgi:hypothetical protein
VRIVASGGDDQQHPQAIKRVDQANQPRLGRRIDPLGVLVDEQDRRRLRDLGEARQQIADLLFVRLKGRRRLSRLALFAKPGEARDELRRRRAAEQRERALEFSLPHGRRIGSLHARDLAQELV